MYNERNQQQEELDNALADALLYIGSGLMGVIILLLIILGIMIFKGV